MSSEVTDIEAPEAIAEPKRGRKPAEPKAVKNGHKTITIHTGAESDGTAAVKVGVNGKLYLIPRNVPSEVPMEVVDVLRNAKYTDWREVNGEFVRSDRQRFSFTVE